MASSPNDPFRSPRLVYRAIEPTAHLPLFLAFQNDTPAYMNSRAGLHKPQSKVDAEKYMHSLINDYIMASAICLPSTRKLATEDEDDEIPIGEVDIQGPGAGMQHHRYGVLGITIAKEYQSQGYGTEAIEWALNWAFETAGLHRVAVHCYAYNSGARSLYEKLGFKEEMVVREQIFHQGRWWDYVGLGMLEEEWRERREREGVSKF